MGQHHTGHDPVRRGLEALLGVPFTEGNGIEVLRNGDEIFPAWLEEIDRAERSIDLLSYLWGTGPVTHQIACALAGRARDGVRVRVLLDAVGSKGIDHDEVEEMRSAGARVDFYHPVPTWRITALNARSHRRALVCDEHVALTGGTGIDRAWTGDGASVGQWRDTSVRVQGPVVAGIRGAFAAAWVQTDSSLIGSEDQFPVLPHRGSAGVQVVRPASQPGWNDAMVALLTLLHFAERRVRIATPYARLPAPLLQAVAAAAGRGVQVQLLVPGPHIDHPLVALQGHHTFGALLDAGVEIWRYQPSMLHAKIVTVDNRLSMVGSVNVDARSLVLNEQVALIIDDPSPAGALDDDFDDDLARSQRTTRREWSQRGRSRSLLERAAYAAGRPLSGMGAAAMTAQRPITLTGRSPFPRTPRGGTR